LVLDLDICMSEDEAIGIRTAAQPHIHDVDRRDVIRSESKIEDGDIFGDPLLPKRFWNCREPVIDTLTRHDLRRRLPRFVASVLTVGWLRESPADAARAI
jgi:hypothetical protein